jgi:hypothetical protein
MVLRTLAGRTLCGLCLPSPCALIIADRDPLVKGFSEIFSEFFCPSRFSAPTDPLRDLADQTSRHFGRIIRTLVRHCCPPCLGGGAQTHRLPTFRAIAPCSGGHQIPLESSPFDGLILSHFSGFVKGVLRSFYEAPQLVLGSISRWKACTSPLGVPLLGSQRASLRGAGVRIPS